MSENESHNKEFEEAKQQSEQNKKQIIENDEEKDLVKRYIPVYGIGSFLCCDCIIEAAQDFILDEFPDLVYYETHSDDLDEEESAEVAAKCLMLLAKKFLPENSGVFFLNAANLLNHPTPGTVFIGCNVDMMEMQETKEDYIKRVSELLFKLNIFNNKKKENQDNKTLIEEPEHDHEIETLEIDVIQDICVVFSEKRDENDKDDLDIGYDHGFSEGVDENYYLIQVALYKMYKKKKIKDLNYILEELHDTLAGMSSEDMKNWGRKFNNYMDKKEQKEKMLDMGDE